MLHKIDKIEVKHVGAIQKITEKFSKVELYIVEKLKEDKENIVSIQVTGIDGMESVQSLQPGDKVQIEFFINGNKYNNKIYNNLSLYTIKKWDGDKLVSVENPKAATQTEEEIDNLPF